MLVLWHHCSPHHTHVLHNLPSLPLKSRQKWQQLAAELVLNSRPHTRTAASTATQSVRGVSSMVATLCIGGSAWTTSDQTLTHDNVWQISSDLQESSRGPTQQCMHLKWCMHGQDTCTNTSHVGGWDQDALGVMREHSLLPP